MVASLSFPPQYTRSVGVVKCSQTLISKIHFLQCFPSAGLGQCLPQHVHFFLGGLQLWDPQPFLIYVPLLVVFCTLRPVCRVSTLSILCRVTKGASSILCSHCLLRSKPEFFQEAPCFGAAHGVHLVSYQGLSKPLQFTISTLLLSSTHQHFSPALCLQIHFT